MGERSLSFPKTVVIRNTRLFILYYILILSSCVGLVHRFISQGQYLGAVDISNDIDVSTYVITPSDGDFAAQQAKSAADPVCTHPEKYDYWWDDGYKYETRRCLWVCIGSPADYADDCAPETHLFIREAQDQLLLVTRREVVQWEPNVGEVFRNSGFLASVDAMGIGIAYTYEAKVPIFQWPYVVAGGFGLKEGSSRTNMLSVLINSEGKMYDTVDSSGSLVLSLLKLFELAGKPNFLDSPDETKTVNQLKGAHFDYPSGRVSGGVLTVGIDCRDRPANVEGFDKLNMEELSAIWNAGSYGAVCLLTFDVGYDKWAYSEKALERANGAISFITESGIRVKFHKTGKFTYIDVNMMFLNITSAIVVLEMVKQLMLFVTVRCLGLLSTIYKTALFETFDIGDEVAGVATRLMAGSVSFNQLSKPAGHVGAIAHKTSICGKNEISREDCELAFKDLLAGEAFLDKQEILAFASFCWSATVTSARAEVVDECSEMLQCFSCCGSSARSGGRASTDEDEEDGGDSLGDFKNTEVMNIRQFNHAVSSFERIEFKNVCRLFDDDVEGSRHGVEKFCIPLEKMFMPRGLVRAREEAKRYVRTRRRTTVVSEDQDAAETTLVSEPVGARSLTEVICAANTPGWGTPLTELDDKRDDEFEAMKEQITSRIDAIEKDAIREVDERIKALEERMTLESEKTARDLLDRIRQVEDGLGDMVDRVQVVQELSTSRALTAECNLSRQADAELGLAGRRSSRPLSEDGDLQRAADRRPPRAAQAEVDDLCKPPSSFNAGLMQTERASPGMLGHVGSPPAYAETMLRPDVSGSWPSEVSGASPHRDFVAGIKRIQRLEFQVHNIDLSAEKLRIQMQEIIESATTEIKEPAERKDIRNAQDSELESRLERLEESVEIRLLELERHEGINPALVSDRIEARVAKLEQKVSSGRSKSQSSKAATAITDAPSSVQRLVSVDENGSAMGSAMGSVVGSVVSSSILSNADSSPNLVVTRGGHRHYEMMRGHRGSLPRPPRLDLENSQKEEQCGAKDEDPWDGFCFRRTAAPSPQNSPRSGRRPPAFPGSSSRQSRGCFNVLAV